MSARCWACQVEPVELHEITAMADAEKVYLPRWPADGDHEHAERPPTPDELVAAGARALDQVMRAWTE